LKAEYKFELFKRMLGIGWIIIIWSIFFTRLFPLDNWIIWTLIWTFACVILSFKGYGFGLVQYFFINEKTRS